MIFLRVPPSPKAKFNLKPGFLKLVLKCVPQMINAINEIPLAQAERLYHLGETIPKLKTQLAYSHEL